MMYRLSLEGKIFSANMIRLAALIFLGSLFLGCDTYQNTPVSLGEWGSAQLSLMVTQTGAILEFSCASGTINEPILTNKAGAFSVRGDYTPGSGAPPPEGYVPTTYPITAIGTVSGQRMTLTISRRDEPIEIGRFMVSRGTPAKLQKCPNHFDRPQR